MEPAQNGNLNDIQLLERRLKHRAPGIIKGMDVPADPENGLWHLDLAANGFAVIVGWKKGKGFGIEDASPGTEIIYGEGWGDACQSIDEVVEKISQILHAKF